MEEKMSLGGSWNEGGVYIELAWLFLSVLAACDFDKTQWTFLKQRLGIDPPSACSSHGTTGWTKWTNEKNKLGLDFPNVRSSQPWHNQQLVTEVWGEGKFAAATLNVSSLSA